MNCLLAEGTRIVIGIKAKKCQGRFFVDKVPVLDILGRGGRVIYTVVRNTSYKQLIAPILRSEKRNVILYMIW